MDIKEVIKEIESSGNKQAIRFEPHFYESLEKRKINDMAIQRIQKIHRCSYFTALMIASTSWGLFQIMGYNLYFYSLTEKTVFEFLFDEAEQEKAFEKFIQIKSINFSIEEMRSDPEKIRKFAKVYNGDTEGYSRKIERLIQNV